MRLKWSFLCLAMLAAVALFSAGCAGINASESVSPASFFLPGILRADPPAATNAPVAMSDMSSQFAQAR